ncbi:MAG: beta-N-acetylhexosaminidase [Clostridia bacterium]|nr:beta-N-acetylhexosaminidase [Clostridia bacterium]
MTNELKKKIGQMISAGFPSPYVDEQAKRLAKEYYVGNFVLFGRNLQKSNQACQLCQDLINMTMEHTDGIVPLISLDQEGGAVSRIYDGASLIPGTMAVAASGAEDAYTLGNNSGRILRAIGINIDNAPVLDVNVEPKNPIIGARAFGDDPEMVSKLGVSMMGGMMDGGMAAAVKHYPGHGNTTSDSHLANPVNHTKRSVLEETEWKPFKDAFKAGADAIMTAHVIYTDVDTEPATLSYKIMTEILRGEQGFKGIVLTDCLEMNAIKVTYGFAEGAVRAIEAGCDILTFSHTFEAVEEAVLGIYAAIESGRLTEERINLSYDRIMRIKEKYGLIGEQKIDFDYAKSLVDDQEMIDYHASISAKSITLLSQSDKGIDVLDAGRMKFFSPESIALVGAEDVDKERLSVARDAQARYENCVGITMPLNELDEATEKEIEADDYDVAVVALYNARFRDGQLATLRKLEETGKPLVVLLMGAPYDASLIERADAVVAAYEYTPLSVNAVLDALVSRAFPGKCPVKI